MYQVYRTKCTNCTVPSVPTVPYQVYQLYQVYRTVFLMYQMYCTKKTTQKRQKTTQKRQKTTQKRQKTTQTLWVQFRCSVGRTKDNWNGTWVQYRWYSWCSTGGTVGAVQVVQLVQYRWYSWCSTGGTVDIVRSESKVHIEYGYKYQCISNWSIIFFHPQGHAEFNSCLNSGISITEKYASQWCQKIPCACLPMLCYSALGQDKANASCLPYSG